MCAVLFDRTGSTVHSAQCTARPLGFNVFPAHTPQWLVYRVHAICACVFSWDSRASIKYTLSVCLSHTQQGTASSHHTPRLAACVGWHVLANAAADGPHNSVIMQCRRPRPRASQGGAVWRQVRNVGARHWLRKLAPAAGCADSRRSHRAFHLCQQPHRQRRSFSHDRGRYVDTLLWSM